MSQPFRSKVTSSLKELTRSKHHDPPELLLPSPYMDPPHAQILDDEMRKSLHARIKDMIKDSDILGLLRLSLEDARVALEITLELLREPGSLDRSKLLETAVLLIQLRVIIPNSLILEVAPDKLKHFQTCECKVASEGPGVLAAISEEQWGEGTVAMKRFCAVNYDGLPTINPDMLGVRATITSLEGVVDEPFNETHNGRLPGFEPGRTNRALPPCIFLEWVERDVLKYLKDLSVSAQEYGVRVNVLLRQIASGLQYLHSRGVTHGNIHGRNVLVDAQGNAKLTDIAFCRVYDIFDGSSERARWAAPETQTMFVTGSGRPSIRSDIYMFACTCIELYTLKWPFSEKGYPATKIGLLILKEGSRFRPSRPTLPDGTPISDDLWSLIERCWDQDPLERPTADEVLGLMAVIAPVTDGANIDKTAAVHGEVPSTRAATDEPETPA
ncbi:hypothetical protein EIP91_003767 [Steccherinum ochraceum]|uniref:Protein kinase domain-containing protein n=1 Tax=Steccherinum ochraceum TaxID=92696 RepID=A0A4R0RDB4_9APHY|nr:hypothetical protein EIP91_003767 [Steccherinum ochraceum]